MTSFTNLCAITYLDENGKEVGSRNGYVPDYFPEQHYGDYIEFKIDVETGRIINWKKPTQEELEDSIETK